MNTQELSLDRVDEGDRVKIRALHSGEGIRRRLQDIGLVQGTVVKCLQKSPSGDPVAYYIRGAVIALRNEDSANIIVERV